MNDTLPETTPVLQLPALHNGSSGDDATDKTRERLRQLPPEVGAVLVGVGIMGMILPGPVGTPLILAGGLVLVPKAFTRVERWVQQKFPKMHRHGMAHVDRFLDDFEKRFPQPPR